MDIWPKDKPLNLEKIAEHFKEKCVFGPDDLQRMALRKAHGVVLEKKASFAKLCNALVPGSMEKLSGVVDTGAQGVSNGTNQAMQANIPRQAAEVLYKTPLAAETPEQATARVTEQGAGTGSTGAPR